MLLYSLGTILCFLAPNTEVCLGQGGTGLRKILRQTVEGGVGRNCRKYLDKPGTKFRLSISQSVDRGGGDELSNCVLPR